MEPDQNGSSKSIIPFRPEKKAKISAAQEGITSLLSKATRFEGDLLLKEGIKIDGHFIGSITIPEEMKGLFVLADSGCVEGSIHVGRATIAGKVVGRLTAASITILPSARIEGEVFYDTLRISDGATINAQLCRRPSAIEEERPIETEKGQNIVQLTTSPASS